MNPRNGNYLLMKHIVDTYGVENLPQDLIDFLRSHNHLTDDLSWDEDAESIRTFQNDMFRSTLRFDIENCSYWPKVFGAKPESLDESVENAMEHINTLPPLIPVEGFKYFVPTVTSPADQPPPVISFSQFIDTIYAFQDLEHFKKQIWLDDETRQKVPRAVGWQDIFDGLGADDEGLYLPDSVDG